MTLPTPTLETERLRLRPFVDTDADALFELQSDAHVLLHWAYDTLDLNRVRTENRCPQPGLGPGG
ncbi:GNAT family N-acetyltransferase [Nocardioides limicola]|uniref:GNAT family N-acetyltransferase n=1 Tax=Nocardioides limicola TaxID=2803368 RepID=UPI00193C2A6C|nr:GNAT family protein [Nocardioides sp. DJM-14]